MEVISFPNKKHCILVDKIKLSLEHALIISRLKICKVENFVFNEEDNLWYYKNYKSTIKLYNILYDRAKNKNFTFINEDHNDYRIKNIKIDNVDNYNTYKIKDIKINETVNTINITNSTTNNTDSNLYDEFSNYEILENGESYLISHGKYTGQYRNMYWKIKDKNNDIYYIMHIKDTTYTKFSLNDINKVLYVKGNRSPWYLHKNGYVASSCTKNHKYYYLHQVIMDVHTEDLTSFEKTVDHINHNKLDNRKENLRLVNMSVQNSNRDKSERRCDAIELPSGISQKDLPKYVCYRKEMLDTDKYREYFYISNHPKCKRFDGNKSSKFTIQEKLAMIKKKLNNLNDVSDSDLESDEDDTKINLPKYISLLNKDNNQYYIYDRKYNDKRYNLKMILSNNDLQLQLDLFINKLNKKYPELVMSMHSIIKSSNQINSEIKTENELCADESDINILTNQLKTDNELCADESDINILTNQLKTDNELCADESGINILTNQLKTDDELCDEKTSSKEYKLEIMEHPITSLENIKIELPSNFSIYCEKNKYYIQYAKTINKIRISKKNTIQCNDIQKELNLLIEFLNKTYPELKISNYTIPSLPKNIKIVNEILIHDKPKMPNNFSIVNVNNIDYIQFSKIINCQKYQYKTKINSYDLQSELNIFIDYLNENYNLKLNKNEYEIIQNNWKTSNKIIDHNNVTTKQLKNREAALKYLAKKKEKLGDEFQNQRNLYMKEYRQKKLLDI